MHVKLLLFRCSPGDMLHHLQLSTLRSDKESMQLKLQQAHEKIASLEMENVDLKIKFEKGTGKDYLEEQFSHF